MKPQQLGMRKHVLNFILIMFTLTTTYAQVGIGTNNPHQSAILDLQSLNKGLLIPQIPILNGVNDPNAVPEAAFGLLIFSKLNNIEGFYYNSSHIVNVPTWTKLGTGNGGGDDWTVIGNLGLNDQNNFLGTIDSVDVVFRTNNKRRAFVKANGDFLALGAPSQDFSSSRRFEWNAQKFGIKAGSGNNIQWDDINVGEASIAVGTSSIASGMSSAAFGDSTEASGLGAFASGHKVVANGLAAFGTGSVNVASGNVSFVAGEGNTVDGDYAAVFGNKNKITIAGKGAFIAGLENHVFIGEGSFIGGKKDTLSANYTAAFGYINNASGEAAFVAGKFNKAKGEGSFAAGNTNIAEGKYSTVFGSSNNVNGEGSFAIGTGNTVLATATNSVAIGNSVLVSGKNSLIGGVGSTSSSDNTIAIGNSVDALAANSVAFGDQTQVLATGSMAGGFISTVSGAATNSLAWGNEASVSGVNTVAFGDHTKASKAGAFATGFYSTASGDNSVAMGTNNNATNGGAVAFGLSTNATGVGSLTSGSVAKASGNYSTALGQGVEAKAQGSVTIGMYNDAATDGGNNIIKTTDRMFQIGAGELLSPKTIFTVLRDGKVGMGNNMVAPKAALHIKGILGGGFESTHLRLEDPSSTEYGSILYTTGLKFRNSRVNDIYAFYNSTGNNILMQLDNSGNAIFTGKLTASNINCANVQCVSDIRLKEDIAPLFNALDNINRIQPITYYFKDKEKYPSTHQIGFSAQEIEKEFPELVVKNDKGYLTINYPQMTAVAIEGIKEQQEIIDTQNKKISDLEKQVELLKVQMESVLKKLN